MARRRAADRRCALLHRLPAAERCVSRPCARVEEGREIVRLVVKRALPDDAGDPGRAEDSRPHAAGRRVRDVVGKGGDGLRRGTCERRIAQIDARAYPEAAVAQREPQARDAAGRVGDVRAEDLASQASEQRVESPRDVLRLLGEAMREKVVQAILGALGEHLIFR